MRYLIPAAAACLLLTGCGGDPPVDDQPTAAGTTTSTTPTTPTTAATPPADDAAFLADVAGAGLLGTYSDAELVTLGHAMCDSRSRGQEPTAGATTTGDGTWTFPGVAAPVWAVDTIGIDLAARQHLCPGV